MALEPDSRVESKRVEYSESYLMEKELRKVKVLVPTSAVERDLPVASA